MYESGRSRSDSTRSSTSQAMRPALSFRGLWSITPRDQRVEQTHRHREVGGGFRPGRLQRPDLHDRCHFHV